MWTRVLATVLNIIDATLIFGFSRYAESLVSDTRDTRIFLRHRSTEYNQEDQEYMNNMAWQSSVNKDWEQVQTDEAIYKGSVLRMVIAMEQDARGRGRPPAELVSQLPVSGGQSSVRLTPRLVPAISTQAQGGWRALVYSPSRRPGLKLCMWYDGLW